MDNFYLAINTVLPFLIYISFGYGVRCSGLVDEAFMNKLNKMIFRAFFPVMMFSNVYHIKDNSPDPFFVAVALSSILFVLLILLILIPRIVPGNPQRGVIVQAIYRSNFVLFGIPLTTHLFGDEGAAFAAMLIAFVIPTYNVTAVIALEMFHGKNIQPVILLKNVITNPMILGVLAALLFRVLGIHIPAVVDGTIIQFADLTTPLALFVLGGTLHFSAVHGNLRYLVPSLFTKLCILPCFALLLGLLLHFSTMERFLLFQLFATPVATASYAMAQNMGGDGELAGQFVVFSTTASVFTLFLWIFFMKSVGLI